MQKQKVMLSYQRFVKNALRRLKMFKIMTLEELRELTFSTHKKNIIQSLNDMNIPFKILTNGNIVVFQEDVKPQFKKQLDQPQQSKQNNWTPNFE